LLVTDGPILSLRRLAGVSPLACFFYVALFKTARSFLEPFASSNPTWIKIPEDLRARVRPTAAVILSEFRARVSRMGAALGTAGALVGGSVTIEVADSTSLPLGNESVDHIVTSPPYCTRIDYVAATRPELAILGIGSDDIPTLRRASMGGVLTAGPKPRINNDWGDTCLRFLEAVRTHSSQASQSYYFNTHLQYFDKLFRSIAEISRTLKPDGSCVMVVQDSFYKAVHNHLQAIATEMAAKSGLSLSERTDFCLSTTLAAINSRHQRHRSASGATESVLWFKKSQEVPQWK
jgi:hypothetical protein